MTLWLLWSTDDRQDSSAYSHDIISKKQTFLTYLRKFCVILSSFKVNIACFILKKVIYSEFWL